MINFPDNLAVVTESSSLTYRELGAMADNIATHLGALPSGRELPIALLMKDEPSLVAAMLGALKIGRLFVALDPSFAEGWLTQVIADSGVEFIVADGKTHSIAERIAAGAGITILKVEQLGQTCLPSPVGSVNSPDAPALIIYTSGSTGKPKGVVLSHRTVLHTPDVRAELLDLQPTARVANLRSSGVLAGVHNTLLPLLNGACLFPFDLRRRGLHGLTPWLSAQKITGVTFSGSLLRTWLSSLPAESRFPSLRFVVASSEPLYGADVVALAHRLEGDWRIMHTLASTETGIIAAQMFDPSSRLEAGIVPVGQVVRDTEIRLEKEDGSLAGPGEPGEIIVNSPFVALGYWNGPGAIARFTHTNDEGSGKYRSGDLGRWRSDGLLEYLGRKNRKIKLRGFSVEPREIECALVTLPNVRDAIVTVSEQGIDDISLIAYAVIDGERTAEAGRALHAALSKLLPAHMVPSHVIVLAAFPLTPRGKVDRAALPAPPAPGQTRDRYRAPSDEYERALTAIWKRTLKIPRIGVDDDFYDLGGTSLQAFLIFAAIASQLSCDLPPTSMMQAPTVAKQAELLRRSVQITPPNVLPFRTTGARSPLFIVHARFGDIMFVKEIVRDLKSDRPVYGLQPSPLDGKHRIPRTIEAIATQYLAAVRKVQPKGPYYLAGFSWGGRLALEISQQLIRQGEHVAFLGLIDTAYHLRYEVAWERFAARMRRHLNALQRRKIGSYVGHRIRRTAIHRMRYFRKALPQTLNRIRLWLGRPIPYLQRAAFYNYVYGRATARYRVMPYRGSIAMFACQGRSNVQRERWSTIALGGLTIREIPAVHVEMVWPPYSAMLAAAFDECLDETSR